MKDDDKALEIMPEASTNNMNDDMFVGGDMPDMKGDGVFPETTGEPEPLDQIANAVEPEQELENDGGMPSPLDKEPHP